MAFTGSLEDLSVIDIIQLIHVSKKSGTVNLESYEKRASIAFRDGDIIGVTHPQAEMNTGFILLEMDLVTKTELLEASRKQEAAGDEAAVRLVLDPSAVEEDLARDVLLEAGQMSIHDTWLVHGSAPNRSPDRRAALVLRYMPAAHHFDHIGGNEAARRAGAVTDSRSRTGKHSVAGGQRD